MPFIPANATSNEHMSNTYDDMISAIYAGQAIERLPLYRNNKTYTAKDIAHASGSNGNSNQIKKIRELLKQSGYKDSDLDNESGWFTYLGAIAAIKNVAPAVLEHYGRP